MSEVVKHEESAHWYEQDGTPAYTRLDKKGNERPTTLRDARKENLLPSVTTILKIKANPALERWKLENMLTAALTLPEADESAQSRAERVYEDAQSISRNAMDFGTRLHDAIETRLSNQLEFEVTTDEDIMPWLSRFDAYRAANILDVREAEQSVVGKEGYAGKMDALIDHQEYGLCLVDWKTQNVKKKPNFYDSWVQQLAAYRHALGQKCHLLSVVIDSNKPSDPVEKLWKDDEADHALEVFMACLKLWQLDKKYWPELNL